MNGDGSEPLPIRHSKKSPNFVSLVFFPIQCAKHRLSKINRWFFCIHEKNLSNSFEIISDTKSHLSSDKGAGFLFFKFKYITKKDTCGQSYYKQVAWWANSISETHN